MMKKEALLNKWLQEEKIAHVHGWDFSHIEKYYKECDLPWSYREIIGRYLTPDMKLLDIDTGGAEFILSLNHPYENLAATEGYPPNVILCKEKLIPLGVDFKETHGCQDVLPFEDQTFDMVINRHGDINEKEIWRILKPNGFFITQQVGAENNRNLVKLLLNKVPPLPFPNQYLKTIQNSLEDVGFTTLEAEEVYGPMKFFDVGALVWFAHIIEWEFPNFSVQTCLSNLYHAQEIIEQKGELEGTIHRFYLVLQKTNKHIL